MSNRVTVDAGALRMVLNALRNDAKDGRKVRAEMADELEASAQPGKETKPVAYVHLVPDNFSDSYDVRFWEKVPIGTKLYTESCVNNHKALVEALKDCVRVFENELSGLAVIGPELRQARAALAAAGAPQ